MDSEKGDYHCFSECNCWKIAFYFQSADPNIITSPVEYESEIPIIEFPEYIFGIIKAHGDRVACVGLPFVCSPRVIQ